MKISEEDFLASVNAVGTKVRKLQKYIKATYDIDITTNDFEEAKEYAENRRKKLCSWSGVEIFDRIEGKVYIINKKAKI